MGEFDLKATQVNDEMTLMDAKGFLLSDSKLT